MVMCQDLPYLVLNGGRWWRHIGQVDIFPVWLDPFANAASLALFSHNGKPFLFSLTNQAEKTDFEYCSL
jgi:hypothetical protein